MAGEKTQIEIDAQIDADIKINGNREITPPKHNAIEKALSNSYVNKKDSGLVIQSLLGYTTELTPSDNKHLTTKKYVDDSLIGDHYFVGSESLDDSVRLHYDVPTKQLIAQIRVSGTWENGTVVADLSGI